MSHVGLTRFLDIRELDINSSTLRWLLSSHEIEGVGMRKKVEKVEKDKKEERQEGERGFLEGREEKSFANSCGE